MKGEKSSKNYYEVGHLQASAISIKTKQLTQCRPHVCDVCNKAFISKTGLTIHMYIHTGEKPFHCSYCPRSFSDPTTLRHHEQRHRGEKDFKCPYCPRAFITNHLLTNHIRVHTGLKPYSCSTCKEEGKKSVFTESVHLTRHIRRHHTHDFPHKCKNCPKEYVIISDLHKHLKSAHGILLPYECSKCDQRFRLKTELQCHEGTHEDNEQEIKKHPTAVCSLSTAPLQRFTNKLVQTSVQSQNTSKGAKSQKVPVQIQENNTQQTSFKKNETEKNALEKKTKILKTTNHLVSKISEKSKKTLKEEIIVVCDKNSNEKSSKKTKKKQIQPESKLFKSSTDNQRSKKFPKTNKILEKGLQEEEIIVVYETKPIEKPSTVTEEIMIIETQNKREKRWSNNLVSKMSEASNKIREEEEIMVVYEKTSTVTEEIMIIETQNKLEKSSSNTLVSKISNKIREEEEIMVEYESPKEKSSKQVVYCSTKLDTNNKRKILDDVSQETEKKKKESKNVKQVNLIEIEDDSQNPTNKTKKQKVMHVIDSQSEMDENEEIVEYNMENKTVEINECSCGKYFSSSSKFKRHRKRRGHRRPRIHICPFCVDESFKTIRAFEKHFNEFHWDNPDEQEEELEDDSDEDFDEMEEDHLLIHECSLCLPQIRSFPTIDALERHYYKLHV